MTLELDVEELNGFTRGFHAQQSERGLFMDWLAVDVDCASSVVGPQLLLMLLLLTFST